MKDCEKLNKKEKEYLGINPKKKLFVDSHNPSCSFGFSSFIVWLKTSQKERDFYEIDYTNLEDKNSEFVLLGPLYYEELEPHWFAMNLENWC